MFTNDTTLVERAIAQQSDDVQLLDGMPLKEIVARALFTAARDCSQPTVRQQARRQAIELMAA